MRTHRTILVGAVAIASMAAQGEVKAPRFAAPVRLQAGAKLLGASRLFPSPVFHDMNGDGLPDIVVGDLFGHLTVALRLPGDGPPRYGEESKVMAADGQPLNFANW
jgi:hypothetical protein